MLVVILVLSILMAILLPAVSKAFIHSKRWIWGTYSFNNDRIMCFLDDDSTEEDLMKFATNKPQPWTFIEMKEDGTWREIK